MGCSSGCWVGGVGGADLGQACHGLWLHDGSCRFKKAATDLIIHPRQSSQWITEPREWISSPGAWTGFEKNPISFFFLFFLSGNWSVIKVCLPSYRLGSGRSNSI